MLFIMSRVDTVTDLSNVVNDLFVSLFSRVNLLVFSGTGHARDKIVRHVSFDRPQHTPSGYQTLEHCPFWTRPLDKRMCRDAVRRQHQLVINTSSV